MSEAYIGEIRLFSFGFAPRFWARCEGQLLPINQNQALFSLLGTTYGGNGQTTFALPDLRGRVPIHVGGSGAPYSLGQRGGEEAHTLLSSEMPFHSHEMVATSADATAGVPTGAAFAVTDAATTGAVYGPPDALVPMGAGAAGVTGSGQPHQNMQPYLTVNFCIALAGIFPSRD